MASDGSTRAPATGGRAACRRACRRALASNGSRPTRTSSAQHPPMRSSQLRPRASGSQPDDAKSTAGPTNGTNACAAHSTSARSVIRQKPAGPKPATPTERMPNEALPSVRPVRPCSTSCVRPNATRSTWLTATSTRGTVATPEATAATASPALGDRGDEQDGADEAGQRQHDPDGGIEREGRRPPTGRCREQPQRRGIRGIGTAVGVETRDRLVVDVESDAHYRSLRGRDCLATQSDRERAVDGERSPSPTQQRTRRPHGGCAGYGPTAQANRCGCGPAASSRS